MRGRVRDVARAEEGAARHINILLDYTVMGRGKMRSLGEEGRKGRMSEGEMREGSKGCRRERNKDMICWL